MLEPKSGRTQQNPKPSRLLSKKKLKEAWDNSRDSTADAGRPGIDGVTAQSFAANLDSKLANLSKKLRLGAYGPTRLKSVFIPKANSAKGRMICIPSVADRLIQRVIVEYLVSNKKLPIYNSSSFGFIKGLGPKRAISAAIELREKYDWCLKTDIETFFDSIPRPYLRLRVEQALGRHSLVPIIHKIIECDIRLNPANREKIRQQGLRLGIGLRQGMPLSPILANLVLSKFDAEIERNKVEMVRYADDLLLFFRSKEEASAGHEFVKLTLRKIELRVPEIEDASKTFIIAPRQPVEFLGREIVYVGAEAKYVARISDKQIAKIKQQIKDDFAFVARSKLGSTLQDTVVEMWRSIAAYLGAYKDAHNFPQLNEELRGIARATISQMFLDIFGKDALSRLTSQHKDFLGIGHLNFPEPLNDIEI